MAIRYLSGINVDSNTLFVDDANNRVGIGTASPAYPLDIVGFANSSSGFRVTDGTIDNRVSWSSGNVGFFGTVSNHPIAFNTNLTERMRITSAGNVFFNATSAVSFETFGVAHQWSRFYTTSSTDYALVDIGNATTRVRIGVDSSSGGSLATGTSAYASYVGSSGSYPLQLGSYGGVAITINSSNNVGIGTTSPVAALHVQSAATKLFLSNTDFNTSTSTGSGLILHTGASSGNTYGQIYAFQSGNTSYANLVVPGGKVGIGTTSPAAKFQVTDASSSITLQNYLNGAAIFLDGVNGDFIGGDYFHILADGSSYLGVGGYAGGATPLNVSNAGNVGIGTNSPSRLFDVSAVNPQMTLKSTTTTGFSEYYFSDSAGDPGYLSYAHNGDYLSIGVNSADRMRITSGGNVLIGTTTDSGFKLRVNGTGFFDGTLSSATEFRLNNNSYSRVATLDSGGGFGGGYNFNWNNGTAIYDSNGAVSALAYANDGTLRMFAGAGALASASAPERLRIKSTGAVQLNSYGSGSFTGTVAYNLAVDSSGNIIETAGGVVDGSGTANYVSKWSDANTLTDSQLFDNGTNVGIGTTSPISKLQVNGQFRQLYSRAFISNPLDTDGYAGHIIVNSNNANGDLAGIGLYTNSSYSAAAGLFALQESSTAASMVFYAGSNLATERMRITSAGNVGIGTTSPGAKLDIYGASPTTVYESQLRIYGSETTGNQDTGGAIAFSGHDGVAGRTFGFIRSMKENSAAGNYAGYMSFGTRANGSDLAEKMRITAAGNVGIGTTSPGAKLDVAGDIRLGGTATYNSVSVYNNSASGGGGYLAYQNGVVQAFFGAAGWYTGTTDTGVVIGTDSSSRPIRFYTDTERMRITGDGNVGIGTTSPAVKLHVVGTESRFGGVASGYISVYNANSRSGYLQANEGSDFRIASDTNDMTFYVNGSERMRITAAGNVGIWTTSPSFSLSVDRATTATAQFNTNGNMVASFRSSTVSANAWAGLKLMGDEGSGIWFSDEGGTYNHGYISQRYTGQLDFATGTDSTAAATVKMTILSGGNVGIGTTSPAKILTIAASSQTWASAPQVAFYDTVSGEADARNWTVGAISTNYGNFTIASSTAAGGDPTTPRLTINKDGNLGIGTTSPDRGLTISRSNQYASLNIYKSNTTNQIAYLGTGSSGPDDLGILQLSDVGTVKVQIYTGGNSYFNGGNVGIGTTAPTSKLYIEGGSADWNETTPGLSVGTIHLDPGTDTNDYGNAITFGASDSGGGGNAHAGIYLRSDGNYGTKMYFATTDSYAAGSKTRMFIGHDGLVGIGTTSPSQRLHVSGNIRVTGAYYDSSNSAGSSGQVLSSTGSGTAWVNQGEATATSLYDLLPAARTTYDWTVQLTAGTWADIFSSNTVLSNGTWMVQAFVNDYAVGGQQYSETYSGVMSWGSAGGTNNDGVDAESEIILHRSGHAAQAGNFYLRTVERAASTLLFQGMSNQTYSAASTINFKFVKIF